MSTPNDFRISSGEQEIEQIPSLKLALESLKCGTSVESCKNSEESQYEFGIFRDQLVDRSVNSQNVVTMNDPVVDSGDLNEECSDTEQEFQSILKSLSNNSFHTFRTKETRTIRASQKHFFSEADSLTSKNTQEIFEDLEQSSIDNETCSDLSMGSRQYIPTKSLDEIKNDAIEQADYDHTLIEAEEKDSDISTKVILLEPQNHQQDMLNQSSLEGEKLCKSDFLVTTLTELSPDISENESPSVFDIVTENEGIDSNIVYLPSKLYESTTVSTENHAIEVGEGAHIAKHDIDYTLDDPSHETELSNHNPETDKCNKLNEETTVYERSCIQPKDPRVVHHHVVSNHQIPQTSIDHGEGYRFDRDSHDIISRSSSDNAYLCSEIRETNGIDGNSSLECSDEGDELHNMDNSDHSKLGKKEQDEGVHIYSEQSSPEGEVVTTEQNHIQLTVLDSEVETPISSLLKKVNAEPENLHRGIEKSDESNSVYGLEQTQCQETNECSFIDNTLSLNRHQGLNSLIDEPLVDRNLCENKKAYHGSTGTSDHHTQQDYQQYAIGSTDASNQNGFNTKFKNSQGKDIRERNSTNEHSDDCYSANHQYVVDCCSDTEATTLGSNQEFPKNNRSAFESAVVFHSENSSTSSECYQDNKVCSFGQNYNDQMGYSRYVVSKLNPENTIMYLSKLYSTEVGQLAHLQGAFDLMLEFLKDGYRQHPNMLHCIQQGYHQNGVCKDIKNSIANFLQDQIEGIYEIPLASDYQPIIIQSGSRAGSCYDMIHEGLLGRSNTCATITFKMSSEIMFMFSQMPGKSLELSSTGIKIWSEESTLYKLDIIIQVQSRDRLVSLLLYVEKASHINPKGGNFIKSLDNRIHQPSESLVGNSQDKHSDKSGTILGKLLTSCYDRKIFLESAEAHKQTMETPLLIVNLSKNSNTNIILDLSMGNSTPYEVLNFLEALLPGDHRSKATGFVLKSQPRIHAGSGCADKLKHVSERNKHESAIIKHSMLGSYRNNVTGNLLPGFVVDFHSDTVILQPPEKSSQQLQNHIFPIEVVTQQKIVSDLCDSQECNHEDCVYCVSFLPSSIRFGLDTPSGNAIMLEYPVSIVYSLNILDKTETYEYTSSLCASGSITELSLLQLHKLHQTWSSVDNEVFENGIQKNPEKTSGFPELLSENSEGQFPVNVSLEGIKVTSPEVSALFYYNNTKNAFGGLTDSIDIDPDGDNAPLKLEPEAALNTTLDTYDGHDIPVYSTQTLNTSLGNSLIDNNSCDFFQQLNSHTDKLCVVDEQATVPSESSPVAHQYEGLPMAEISSHTHPMIPVHIRSLAESKIIENYRSFNGPSVVFSELNSGPRAKVYMEQSQNEGTWKTDSQNYDCFYDHIQKEDTWKTESQNYCSIYEYTKDQNDKYNPQQGENNAPGIEPNILSHEQYRLSYRSPSDFDNSTTYERESTHTLSNTSYISQDELSSPKSSPVSFISRIASTFSCQQSRPSQSAHTGLAYSGFRTKSPSVGSRFRFTLQHDQGSIRRQAELTEEQCDIKGGCWSVFSFLGRNKT